jgi:hypothetical protein
MAGRPPPYPDTTWSWPVHQNLWTIAHLGEHVEEPSWYRKPETKLSCCNELMLAKVYGNLWRGEPIKHSIRARRAAKDWKELCMRLTTDSYYKRACKVFREVYHEHFSIDIYVVFRWYWCDIHLVPTWVSCNHLIIWTRILRCKPVKALCELQVATSLSNHFSGLLE